MTGREKIQRHVISEILLQLQHAAIKDIRPYSIGSTTAIGPINKHNSGDQAPAVSCSKDTVQGNTVNMAASIYTFMPVFVTESDSGVTQPFFPSVRFALTMQCFMVQKDCIKICLLNHCTEKERMISFRTVPFESVGHKDTQFLGINAKPQELVFLPDLEKFSIKSLAHQWILCSEWVPSEWECKAFFFYFKPLLPKNESSVHNTAFSSEKQNNHIWIRREICTDHVSFISSKQSKSVLDKYVSGFWYENTTGNYLKKINY